MTKRPTTLQTGETCLTVKTTRAARGSTNVRIVRRRAFRPLVAIQERDASRRAPFVPAAAALAPDGLPVALPPGAGLPDGVAVAVLAATRDPVDSDVPLTCDPPALTVGVDPLTVGAGGAEGVVGVADPGFGRAGAGGGFGTVVDGAGGGFGTVTVGAGGSFGTVTVEVGRGSGAVVTVTVVTPGMGTETARACPATSPQAANPIRTAAALIRPQLRLARNGCGFGQVAASGG
jgi:hypothetical protein